MRIAYVAAGAAGMYCGSCLHDNALAAALLAAGHAVEFVPAYTPLRTDEPPVARARIAYGAINVYLAQVLPAWSRAPGWVRRRLDHPGLLAWVGRLGGATDASSLGPLLLSVLRGEEGRQRRELDELAARVGAWRPDVVHLSNALLLGLARRLGERGRAPVVCALAGEDLFLDALRPSWRARAEAEMRRRAGDVARFVAPTDAYAAEMRRRLDLAPERVRVVPLGISLADFPSIAPQPAPAGPFRVGYLARICPEKGLHLLADAFRRLAEQRGRERVRLAIAGTLGRRHRGYLGAILGRLRAGGLAGAVDYAGEVDRAGKIRFLAGLDALCVPAVYPEAKGRYVLEAWAAGVPVVAPRHGAFPELLSAGGGGLLIEPGSAPAIAEALASLAADLAAARRLGAAGRRAVEGPFSAGAMAAATAAVYHEAIHARGRALA